MIVDFIPEDKKELDVYKHLSNSAELLNYVTLNKLDEASLKFLMEKIIIPKILLIQEINCFVIIIVIGIFMMINHVFET